MRVLVVAPHADDEVLGPGGTLAKHAGAGDEVHVVIVTRGLEPRWDAELEETTFAEAARAHKTLGVTQTHCLDFPAAELDRTSHGDVNAALGEVFKELRPERVLVPFGGDLHLDHQRVALSSLVCSRPLGADHPTEVLAYETLSETNWNAPYAPVFVPTVFVDISEHLETKLEALAQFETQLGEFPYERSIHAVRCLAQHRGAQVNRHAAEAFALVRRVC
jgi:LmbE family N-acetylglucosaminyl deacetylase